MSALPPDSEPVRVEADSAELEAPTAQAAVTAVLEEGEQVERIAPAWTAADFADPDWDHPDTRPRLRGWLHLFAFFGAIVAGAVLIPLAAVLGPRAGFSVAVYCVTICGLFGISALYHRRRWSPRGWKIMKRLDHSMIFLFIAGTYTPFSLLAVDQPTGYWVLGIVWGGALLGVTLKLTWPTAPSSRRHCRTRSTPSTPRASASRPSRRSIRPAGGPSPTTGTATSTIPTPGRGCAAGCTCSPSSAPSSPAPCSFRWPRWRAPGQGGRSPSTA
jgi:hypothetical protein